MIKQGRNDVRQTIRFVLLVALSSVIWRAGLISTFALASSNEAYTHILLILPFSLVLGYMEVRRPRPEDLRRLSVNSGVESGRWIGFGLMSLAALLGSYTLWKIPAASDVGLWLVMVALVTWWIGSFLLCFGSSVLRGSFFPLCFLYLLVPLPHLGVQRIVETLQVQSAIAAQVLFRVAAVPATRDGVILFIPGLTIEVASECSSIRSSMMLLISTLVLAHLFLRTWWRKIVLVAAVIPLASLKNGLRIFTIVELGTRVDSGYLTGKLHHQGGIVFFAVAVLIVIALIWMFRRFEPPLVPSTAATRAAES
jgi:exosortase